MKATRSRRDRIRAQLADLKMPGALEAIDEVLTIDSLHEFGFLQRKENVIFLGPPGVGKTHLAISLAIAAAQRSWATRSWPLRSSIACCTTVISSTSAAAATGCASTPTSPRSSTRLLRRRAPDPLERRGQVKRSN